MLLVEKSLATSLKKRAIICGVNTIAAIEYIEGNLTTAVKENISLTLAYWIEN